MEATVLHLGKKQAVVAPTTREPVKARIKEEEEEEEDLVQVSGAGEGGDRRPVPGKPVLVEDGPAGRTMRSCRRAML